MTLGFREPDEQTQIGPRTTYWFWPGVTSFNAAFAVLLLLLQAEVSLLAAWLGAGAATVLAGGVHYGITKDEREKSLSEAKEPT